MCAKGRSFVHVTHDQEEAMAIADLMVIMNRGRIEDAGPPTRLYERPRTRFAAQFLGESTLIEGTVLASADGRLHIDTPCGALAVAGQRPLGEQVTPAVRPEALRLGSAAPGEQPLGRLRVEHSAYQGSFWRVAGHTTTGVRLFAKLPPQALPAGAGVEGIAAAVRADGLVLLED